MSVEIRFGVTDEFILLTPSNFQFSQNIPLRTLSAAGKQSKNCKAVAMLHPQVGEQLVRVI